MERSLHMISVISSYFLMLYSICIFRSYSHIVWQLFPLNSHLVWILHIAIYLVFTTQSLCYHLSGHFDCLKLVLYWLFRKYPTEQYFINSPLLVIWEFVGFRKIPKLCYDQHRHFPRIFLFILRTLNTFYFPPKGWVGLVFS